MPALMLNGNNYTGGGGNANEQVLTWDEYCALTPEEKMNGTTYYITDVNGDGQSFQPVIFSLEEREIGVWTDGKPLYQKTFYIPNPTYNVQAGTRVADSAFEYIDQVVSIEGTFKRLSNANVMTYKFDGGEESNISTGDVYGWVRVDISDTGRHGILYFIRVRNESAKDAIITIRYTKTTDQPGSGTWTPQGVPAVHYDDNEKVVGTWFGETLYEKTITYNATGQMGEGTYTLGTISVADKMMIESAFVYNTDDGRVYFLPYSNGSSTSSLLTDVSKNILLRVKNDSWGVYNTFYVTVRYTKSSS